MGPSDRTLSDVGKSPTPEPAPRGALAHAAWWPNGTQTTSGSWWSENEAKAHFFPLTVGPSAICNQRAPRPGGVHVREVYSLAELCGNCLRKLNARALPVEKDAQKKAHGVA